MHNDRVSVSRWQSLAPAALSDHDYALSHQLPHADSLPHNQRHDDHIRMPFINNISAYGQDKLQIVQVDCFNQQQQKNHSGFLIHSSLVEVVVDLERIPGTLGEPILLLP